MATNNETKAAQTAEETKAAQTDDKVEVFIPKGYANDEPNLFVSVNGVGYLLPKGKTSKVPKAIAYEIARSIKAQQKMDENIDKMLEAANN